MSKFDEGFIKVIGMAPEGGASPPPRSVAARATKCDKCCSLWKRGWQEATSSVYLREKGELTRCIKTGIFVPLYPETHETPKSSAHPICTVRWSAIASQDITSKDILNDKLPTLPCAGADPHTQIHSFRVSVVL
jgi:hypothetical protein